MAKYLKVAEEANSTVRELLELIPVDYRHQAAIHCARLVNYGLRCSPRPVQSTVRLRAVQKAVEGTGVKCRLEEKENENGGTYKILITE